VSALGLYNYEIVIVLMMTGFYVVIRSPNLVKKIVGLNIFQTSVFILYISMGKVADGTAPIVEAGATAYSNPLPHVLILTAIVVGVATTALRRGGDPETGPRGVSGENLPILQVIVPLLAAPVCLLLRNGTLAWAVATVVGWYCLYAALTLLGSVPEGGLIRYDLGGWEPPWGIEYIVDRLDAYVLVIVAAIGALVLTMPRCCSASPVCSASSLPATPSTCSCSSRSRRCRVTR
jgi:multicomponent Na+:H+ antiporter subunit C